MSLPLIKKKEVDPYAYSDKVNLGLYDEDKDAIEEEAKELFEHLPKEAKGVEIILTESGKRIVWRRKND